MSSKKKGTRAERELFHMFYDAGMQPVRVAGSGSTTVPSTDLLIGGNGRVLAVECKALKSSNKYFTEDGLKQLKDFSEKFGAEAWIGIRFDQIGWFFLEPKDIRKSGKNYVISLNLAREKGLRFEDLINGRSKIL